MKPISLHRYLAHDSIGHKEMLCWYSFLRQLKRNGHLETEPKVFRKYTCKRSMPRQQSEVL